MALTKKRKFSEDDLAIADNVGNNWKQLFNSGKIKQNNFVKVINFISKDFKKI